MNKNNSQLIDSKGKEIIVNETLVKNPIGKIVDQLEQSSEIENQIPKTKKELFKIMTGDILRVLTFSGFLYGSQFFFSMNGTASNIVNLISLLLLLALFVQQLKIIGDFCQREYIKSFAASILFLGFGALCQYYNMFSIGGIISGSVNILTYLFYFLGVILITGAIQDWIFRNKAD